MRSARRHTRSQCGSALFLILLGIVLFWALSHAVTSSIRGGGQDATKEQSQVYAAELVQYGGMLQNTISRLKLSNNCTDKTISFENAIKTDYVNPSAPAACKIFDQNGGGLVFKKISDDYLDITQSAKYDYGYPAFYNQHNVLNVGLPASTSTEEGKDLVMLIPYLSDSVCLGINRMIGVNSIPSTPWTLAATNTNLKFRGTYWTANTGYDFPSNLVTDVFGCLYASNFSGTGAANVFYYVILPR